MGRLGRRELVSLKRLCAAGLVLLVGSTAAAARLDLAANRARWQLHDRGVVVPVASEGLRRFVLTYTSPWGEVVARDGRRGRELRGTRAELVVPWDGGEGPTRVYVRASGGRQVTVRVDGRVLGRAALGAGWAEVAFDGPALAAGEHKVSLELGAKGALVHSVELAPAAAVSCHGDWPPDGAASVGALAGWRRATLVTELPAAAELRVTPSGGGQGRVAVTSLEGTRTVLFDGPLDGTARTISLAAFGGRLVRLELEADACATARWEGGEIVTADPPPAARPAPATNVILIVVDTLRADRVAAITPTRVVMPRLTAAARRRGVVFPRNQSMAPSSPPSHVTLHTGQIPRVHGAAGDKGGPLPGTPILSALLRDAGFFTGYVGDNDFAMGRLRKDARWSEAHTPTREGQGLDCAPIVARALAMARGAHERGQRFFVSMLPIETHVPYRYHAGITEAYFPGPYDPPIGKVFGNLEGIKSLGMTPLRWDHMRGLYDGEVQHFDGCFGALEDGLAALGLGDSTAIVLCSDHGEGLGERGGRVGHAYSMHHELLWTPLIVLAPGVPPRTMDLASSNIDVAPTVLDLVGVAADARMQGASLLPAALAGKDWPRMVASEYGKSYALRAGRWHYVVDYGGTATLYDVEADREEVVDLSATQPLVLRYFRDAAGLYLAHRVAWRAATWGTLSAIAPTSPLAGD